MNAFAFPHRYRSVFISDLHLGARGCQAELLLDFLMSTECESLYLVGDIVDGWRLKTGWFWPRAHDAVAQHLLALARRGVRVVYVPGNHDAFARAFYGEHLGGIVVTEETVHEAADGKRYLVTHGDLYDGVVTRAKWLAVMGDWAYRALLRANTAWNRARRTFGLGYWSFAAWLKGKVKQAGSFIDDFERTLAEEARGRGLDGVICGHIHRAQTRDIDGVLYVNDGDWVESCTAVVEHACGRLELIDWAERRRWSMLDRRPAPPAAAKPRRPARPPRELEPATA